VKFVFIHAEKARLPTRRLCAALNVSRNGYYAWVGRPPSARAVGDAKLIPVIPACYAKSRTTYVVRGSFATCGRSTIESRVSVCARLMRQEGLSAGPSAAPLSRDDGFEAYAPRRTERRRPRLPRGIRQPQEGLLHHSDRGCQYASDLYRSELSARGIVCGMSRVGDCWDNAVAESFFATLKSSSTVVPGPRRTRPGRRSTTTSVPSTTLIAGTRPSVTSVRWTTNGNTLPERQHSGTVYGIGSTPGSGGRSRVAQREACMKDILRHRWPTTRARTTLIRRTHNFAVAAGSRLCGLARSCGAAHAKP
jgi:hypothetical protein